MTKRWNVILQIGCLVAFVGAYILGRYFLSQQMSATEQQLNDLRPIRKAQLAASEEHGHVAREIDVARALAIQERGRLQRTLASFRRDSMLDELKSGIKIPSTEYLFDIKRRTLNSSESRMLFVPAAGQSLITIVDVDDKPNAKAKLETLQHPDYKTEIPVTPGKLVEYSFEILPPTDDESSVFRFRLDGAPEEEFRLGDACQNGYSNYGDSSDVRMPNSFQISKNYWSAEQVREFAKQGIWMVTAHWCMNLKRPDESVQSLHIIIGLKSEGPFIVDGSERYLFGDIFELTWNSERAVYDAELIKR